jgi:hypothetical protein
MELGDLYLGKHVVESVLAPASPRGRSSNGGLNVAALELTRHGRCGRSQARETAQVVVSRFDAWEASRRCTSRWCSTHCAGPNPTWALPTRPQLRNRGIAGDHLDPGCLMGPELFETRLCDAFGAPYPKDRRRSRGFPALSPREDDHFEEFRRAGIASRGQSMRPPSWPPLKTYEARTPVSAMRSSRASSMTISAVR